MEPLVKILAASEDDLGAVAADEATAVLIVACAHRYRDIDTWGGDRAITYWSRLPDKVRMCTYAGPTLAACWERLARTLGCGQPSLIDDREALARALTAAPLGVLSVLRTETEMVCLRVRLAIQAQRDKTKPQPDQEVST